MEEDDEEELLLHESVYYSALSQLDITDDEEEYEWYEEAGEVEEEEEEEHIPTWDEIPKTEQLLLTKKFVDLIMDLGTQTRILSLIEKAYKKKVNILDCYPPTKCVRREVHALEHCVSQERQRKKKCLLQIKAFLAMTPYGPWDFVTFTTRSLDTPKTEMCLSLNDYICAKLSENPFDGICCEKRQVCQFPDSYFNLDVDF